MMLVIIDREYIMRKFVCSIASLLLCAPLMASAVEGWVVADISLQAGPDPAYPSIEELAAGTPVTIAGCIDGWTWCDVIAFDERGWVPGTFLQEEYSGQRVYISEYGARIGIPVVAFSLGLYWDSHYHNRPFYAERQQWESRAIRPHAPPRPTSVTVTGPNTGAGARQRTTTTTQPQRTTAPATPSAQTATTTQQPSTIERKRDTRRTEQPTTDQQRRETAQQRRPTPAAPEPQPAKPSDAAPQMTPEPPKAEPHAKPITTAHAEKPKARQEGPKAKDELKKPGKKDKDNGDNGGGGDR